MHVRVCVCVRVCACGCARVCACVWPGLFACTVQGQRAACCRRHSTGVGIGAPACCAATRWLPRPPCSRPLRRASLPPPWLLARHLCARARAPRTAMPRPQAVYVPADDLTDPAPATTFAHLDATTVLSRSIAELGIYPAVDPLDSTSRMLDPRILGASARARCSSRARVCAPRAAAALTCLRARAASRASQAARAWCARAPPWCACAVLHVSRPPTSAVRAARAACAVLCCAVLCCAVLCCAVLCCAVLCCAVLCCAVLCTQTQRTRRR
jgi:hypothetical protein